MIGREMGIRAGLGRSFPGPQELGVLISSGGMKLRLGRLEPRGGCGALVGPASRLALTSTAEGQGPGGRERLGGKRKMRAAALHDQ